MESLRNGLNGVCETKKNPPSVLERLLSIQSEIELITAKVHRPEGSCRLLPVSKTVSVDVMKRLCQNGQPLFGENKVQELKTKRDTLFAEGARWHFIGHLQTNKVKECIKNIELLHSVDRSELAIALDKTLQKEGRCLDVLIQVNTSYETSKFGIHPEVAVSFARDLVRFDTIRIKGLMTLAVSSSDQIKVRSCFQKLKVLSEAIQRQAIDGVEMAELSMGMSSDYRLAVEEGSTIVRVGQAIFGERSVPNSYYWNEG